MPPTELAPPPVPRPQPERRGCTAVIPIQLRARAKSRLAAVLSSPARLELVRAMAAHVVSAARAATLVGEVICVTPERDTLPCDVAIVRDSGAGLNAALTLAHRRLLGASGRELLVLAADLPRVTTAEIDALVRAGREGGFAIAPDLADRGTNALYVASVHAFRFQFGEDSKAQHLREARRLHLGARAMRLPGLLFDVDLPADLDRLEVSGCVECTES